MTQPVPHGYPDFGRYQSQSDKFLFQFTYPDIDAPIDVGTFFVGDVRAVGLFLNAATNHLRFAVDFLETESGFNLFSGHTFSIRQGGTFEGSLPVLGPWMRVTVNPSAINSSGTVILWTTNNISQQTAGDQNSNILYFVSGNLPAGATVTTPVYVRTGEAILDYELPATNSRITIDAFDTLGTRRLLCNVFGANINNQRRLYLPPSSLRIEVFNTAAVAQAYFISLQTNPTDRW